MHNDMQNNTFRSNKRMGKLASSPPVSLWFARKQAEPENLLDPGCFLANHEERIVARLHGGLFFASPAGYGSVDVNLNSAKQDRADGAIDTMSEDTSRFLKIWRSGVWGIELFSVNDVQYDSLVKSFGEPDAESDQYDDTPGPAKYWRIDKPCGIKIILQWCDEPGFVNVYANQFEHAHVRRHLSPAISFDGAWSSLDQEEKLVARAKSGGWPHPSYFSTDKSWQIERLDDNANTFTVEENLTERAAKCIAASLEATGHKQSYNAKQKRTTP